MSTENERTADSIIDALASDDDVPKARDEIEEMVEDQLEEWSDKQVSEEADDILRRHAASVVKNDLKNITTSGFGGGETEEFPILTMGYERREGDYFVTDGDALVGSGIVNPPEQPAGFTVFVIDSAHGVDLDHAAHCFEPLNTVRGSASLRQVGSRDDEPTVKKGGNPTYESRSSNDSKFEIVDPDSVPDDDPLSSLPGGREAKRQLIHENFITDEDRVTLQNYADHVSVKNNNGYELAFGVDVKRFRGEVVDAIVFDGDGQSGNGFMTFTDDTVYSAEEIPPDLINDHMRTPGFQVSVAGDLVYGEGSVLDVYGYIQQRDDGQYRMNALGVIPIVEYEYSGPNGSNGGSGDDDIQEDGTIGGS